MNPKPMFVLFRHLATIPIDHQGNEEVSVQKYSRAFLPTHRTCSHYVLQRLNGEALAIRKIQIRQVGEKNRTLGRRKDCGEDLE